MLEALVYLHAPAGDKGVELHCDVKPSNVLLRREPAAGGGARLVAQLADVGLAQQQGDGRTHVSLSGVSGTSGYIDPILVDTQRATQESDGYAAGPRHLPGVAPVS